MAEEAWIEPTAALLDAATLDPLRNAVRGSAFIVSVGEPRGRWRFRECEIVLRLEAAGLDSQQVTLQMVFDSRYWPEPGRTLPARMSPKDPSVYEIDWEALAR